jgi:hypothetical protein
LEFGNPIDAVWPNALKARRRALAVLRDKNLGESNETVAQRGSVTQAIKYSPIFGELIAELVLQGPKRDMDLEEFSIARFTDKSLREFWRDEGASQTLNRL